MNRLRPRNELLIGLLLLLLLAVTRSGLIRSHFGTELHLPDASWAVSWMMGAFTVNRWWPVLLMLLCVAIDYWVIAGGVSADCFTPAYPFLIPAYLSLWMLGRWSRPPLPVNLHSLPRMAISLLLGVSACFVISNVGSYLGSGYIGTMPALHYAQAVQRYWLPYLLNAAMYAGVGVVIHSVVSYWHAARTRSQVQ